MTAPRHLTAVVAGCALAALLTGAAAGPARASVIGSTCKFLKPLPLGAGCSEASTGLTAGRQLLQGNVGGAVGGLAGDAATVGLVTISTVATGSAQYALRETATLIDNVTKPHLEAPWFQRVYWRLAAISVVLTLPCLFAAAVQALIRSDLALLVRAAFGYLPAAMLAVGVCAQVTSLLLAAVDELCSLVSGVADQAATSFLNRAAEAIAAVTIVRSSPFLALIIAGFTIAGAIVLWLELMMRAAAVYVVVAMLPLAFAAFVWPARRIWALRALELLAALILAKLAMVTVLTLAGAALTSAPNVAAFLSGLVLLVLGVMSPWAMLRLVPMAELATGAAGRLRAEAGVPSPPEMLGAAAQGAAHAAGVRFLARGADRARATAESVAAQLTGNQDESDVAPTPEPAREAPPTSEPAREAPASDPAPEGEAPPAQEAHLVPVAAAPPDLADQVTDGTPPDAGPPKAPVPDGPPSPFAAPDHSWPVLDLSPDANWGSGPIWSANEPPGQPPPEAGGDA